MSNNNMTVTEKELSELRERIKEHISGKRYSHTLAVEKEISHLCEIFSMSEQETLTMQVAALLHDITKEKSTDQQRKLCAKGNIPYSAIELSSPKVFHAMTAEVVINESFPEYAIEEILSPIRYHTTGRENMTLGEKLLYLADYIEETRTFPDCVTLRGEFYGVSDPAEKGHLDDVLITSFKMTVRNLLDEDAQIHPATIASLNSLLTHRKER